MSTKIQWTDETWNPIVGCTKVSPGCANCYAERMAKRQVAMGLSRHERGSENDNTWIAYSNAIDPDTGKWSGEITCRPEKLDEPLKWRKPRRVFVCSMSDLFHEGVPTSFIRDVINIIGPSTQHTFQILTKQAERMQELMSLNANPGGVLGPNGLSHVWLGVTAEDQKRADERIPCLLQTPAAVRFVSVEPMLGPVNLYEQDKLFGKKYLTVHANQRFMEHHLKTGHFGNCQGHRAECVECRRVWVSKRGVDWVIIGCESGPRRRPMELEWAIDLVEQCKAAGVAVFVKQLPINGKVSKGPSEWPTELRVREYPE